MPGRFNNHFHSKVLTITNSLPYPNDNFLTYKYITQILDCLNVSPLSTEIEKLHKSVNKSSEHDTVYLTYLFPCYKEIINYSPTIRIVQELMKNVHYISNINEPLVINQHFPIIMLYSSYL